jgi:hypothetical protein
MGDFQGRTEHISKIGHQKLQIHWAPPSIFVKIRFGLKRTAGCDNELRLSPCRSEMMEM